MIEREVAAIRGSAALCTGAHVSAVRVSGPGAFDALDRVCPRELFLQDGQALHTLFLDERAHPVADVYVCADGDDFLLVGESRGGAMLEYLRSHTDGVELDDLTKTHEIISLNGPYAWEVLSDVLTPEIIGLPYLGFFHVESLTCLRAGKTGEYGYDLIVPREEADELRARIMQDGSPYDLGQAGLAALEVCSLENGFFNVRREGAANVTPIDLQLQWRVSYEKSYPGSAALLAQRRDGPRRRTVLISASAELAVGDAVIWGDRRIGELISCDRSPTLESWLGLALLDPTLAHPGISDFRVARAGSLVPIRTLSAPALNNRSLFVDPQRHSYRTRTTDQFPPIGPQA